MLIRDSIFDWILYDRGQNCFSAINMVSVRAKRGWANKSEESKQAFSALMSKRTKASYQKKTKAQKRAISKRFSKGMQKYWDEVSEENKKKHVSKMKKGMQNAWDNADEDFGPLVANKANLKNINGKMNFVEKDRINDYSGVLTMSDMESI